VARSLHALGLLLLFTGDRAGALSAFQEQRDLAAALEAQSPTDAVRVQLAFGHNGIGFVLFDTGKWAEALDAFRNALAIYQKLPEAGQYFIPDQGPTFGLQMQAGVYESIGNVLPALGKRADGLESRRKALDILQKLANANPDSISVQKYLAMFHMNMGRFLAGEPEEALTEYGKALAILQKLAGANPAVSLFQELLTRCHGSMGSSLSDTGKPEEAMAAYLDALAISAKLVNANPSVPYYQSLLTMASTSIGLASVRLRKTGKSAEAMEAQLKALAIYEKLVNANPTRPDYQSWVAMAHNERGLALAHQKRFAEALTAFDTGLAIRQKLAEANPKNTAYATALGDSHARRGGVLVRTGQPSKAAADLRRAVELWPNVAALDPDTRLERFRALALLAGLGGDPKSGVTKAEAGTFAEQAVVALDATVKAGAARSDELKEPEFDALRGREDFKKLLAELDVTSANKLGMELLLAGKPDEAAEAYLKMLAVTQRLVDANPKNLRYLQLQLALAHRMGGWSFLVAGKPDKAMEAFLKGLAVTERLVDADSKVPDYQSLLGQAYIDIGNMGFLLSPTGKPEEAIEACRKALAITQKLPDANPAIGGYQVYLADAHNILGGLLARQQRFAEAFAALDAGLAICQKLTKSNPNNTLYVALLGYSFAYRGAARVRSGQPAEAAADLRQAVESWAKVPPLDALMRFNRSGALALLAGLGADAKSGVTKAEAAAFADQAVASLRDAFSHGWGWLDKLKDPDFDALRDRDDFKKLLTEVEAKTQAKQPSPEKE
jgi:tetratricopeptide (TPR) repeat protein